jgi:hypothetical protein
MHVQHDCAIATFDPQYRAVEINHGFEARVRAMNRHGTIAASLREDINRITARRYAV